MRRIGQRQADDFAVILMLAGVAGAAAEVVGTIIDLGRAAGWCCDAKRCDMIQPKRDSDNVKNNGPELLE